jgi:hypothetical protein
VKYQKFARLSFKSGRDFRPSKSFVAFHVGFEPRFQQFKEVARHDNRRLFVVTFFGHCRTSTWIGGFKPEANHYPESFSVALPDHGETILTPAACR